MRKASICEVCGDLVGGAKGYMLLHMRKRHTQCETCKKWGDDESAHCTAYCVFCHENVCNICMHVQLRHFQCGLCYRFADKASDHPTPDQCQTCKEFVCNINYHYALHISCRSALRPTTISPDQIRPRWVTKKCDVCKDDVIGSCTCRKYPIR